MDDIRRDYIKRIDWLIVAVTLCLLFLGILSIASATSTAYSEDVSVMEYIGSLLTGYTLSQIIYFLIGSVCVFALMLWDYNNIREFANGIYWIGVGLLVAVLFWGTKTRGMTGWFRIGGVGFQPAEFCKLMFIIVLAREFARKTEGKTGGIQTFRDIWPMLWKFAIPFVLICAQPDFGTALVYVCVLLGMMFMAKTSFKIMATILGSGLVAVPILWFSMGDDQKSRIFVFLDPASDPEGAGYNMLRAKTVSSSGGLWGKGFFSQDLLTQKTNYLPEKQTDFIFSTTCESIGFIGGLFVIFLYILLISRMLYLSMQAKDDFGTYLIVGVSFMLLFHVAENIGMNIGVLPVTGIPLPLMSSGGSNLLTTMMSIGLVLNVNMRRSRRLIA